MLMASATTYECPISVRVLEDDCDLQITIYEPHHPMSF